MAYTTSPAPGTGQMHQVVITIVGPKDEAQFRQFTRDLKQLVDRIGGGIGVRGSTETDTGTFIYPPGQGPGPKT